MRIQLSQQAAELLGCQRCSEIPCNGLAKKVNLTCSVFFPTLSIHPLVPRFLSSSPFGFEPSSSSF